MALNDWLMASQAPQPSFLTSRAAGVVVPEYFQQAAEIRKTQLGLAAQEQGLRLQEQEAAARQQEEARRRAAEEAAAAIMPQVANLDRTAPDYYQKLASVMSQPGASNALMSSSMGRFLDVTSAGRQEITADQQRQEAYRREQERYAQQQKDELAREERMNARSSNEDALRLATSYADKVDDPTLAQIYGDRLKNVKTPEERAKVVNDLNFDYNQRKIRKDLLEEGVSPQQIDSLMEGTGNKKFLGEKARFKLAEAKRSTSEKDSIRMRLSVIESKLKVPMPEADKKQLEEERDRLSRSLLPPDLRGNSTERYTNPSAGGSAGGSAGASNSAARAKAPR